MADRNETLSHSCRFLDDSYFHELYEAFVEAFSDYVVPFALTETQFRNHINLNAVDLERSVGCFIDDKLVGFSLNGFGNWNGKPTVYDAGTGVIPAYRRKGLSREMFEMMIPKFTNEGIEQCLLEVISTNKAAIGLYDKLGFKAVRELTLLQCDRRLFSPSERSGDIEIREIADPDWELLTAFWSGNTSWQNSVDAIERSRHMKRILGAYKKDVCVGYIVFSSNFGRVAQLAVSKDHRNSGIGTLLVNSMNSETAEGFSPQIINVDRSLNDANQFFKKLGFYELLDQLEMVKTL